MEKLNEPLDLIICDFHMPNSDPRNLLTEIRNKKLDINIIIMTGDTSDEVTDVVKEYKTKLITKPFLWAELIKVINS